MKHGARIGFHQSGRAGSYAHMYFQMCAEKLQEYRALVKETEDSNCLAENHDRLVDRVQQAAVEPVVYGGMCLEATLFDLAACLYGDEFAEKTDKLDPLGKFYVLSQAVNRCTPDASSMTVQSIRALITARNHLVHHKSASWLDGDWMHLFHDAEKKHQRHIAGLTASFSALVLLSLHFDGNIFEELRILPSFKKTEYWRDLVPTPLHADVNRCIELSAKEHAHAVAVGKAFPPSIV
jgi:hypothetical protein